MVPAPPRASRRGNEASPYVRVTLGAIAVLTVEIVRTRLIQSYNPPAGANIKVKAARDDHTATVVLATRPPQQCHTSLPETCSVRPRCERHSPIARRHSNERLGSMIMMRALRLLCLGVLALLPPPDAYCAETAPATPDPVSASPLQSNGTDHRDARERLKRPSSGASGGGLFETKIWTPPVVEQPRMAAPKPVPVAPRFPYEYMGRMQSDGQPDTVYLTKDSNVYAVSVGDAIEGTYRVLDVSGERLEVMYLPLGTKQQIPFQSIVAAVQPQGMTNTYVNPGLPQSVNTPVPAQFNLAPMFDTARPGEAPQAPVPGGTPRGGNQPPANAAAPTGQQGP